MINIHKEFLGFICILLVDDYIPMMLVKYWREGITPPLSTNSHQSKCFHINQYMMSL